MRPTQPAPPIKRKNQSPLRIIVNQWGCLLAMVMLILGITMGLLGAIFVGPQLLGFDLTATALVEREIVMAATEIELDVQAQDAVARATGFALDVQSTQAILNNNADLLNQTATQSSRNIIGTATANASFNVQRQTQVANDFTGTQAALNANATQVELDFRNTQAALGIESTQIQSQNIVPPSGRYSYDFAQFTRSDTWQLSSVDDWQTIASGLQVISSSAYLIEPATRILPDNNFSGEYIITAHITPAITADADYWLIFGLDGTTGYAAYFYADTLNVTEVGLYQFDAAQLQTLSTDNLTVIQRNAASATLNRGTQLSVVVVDRQVAFRINEETIFTARNLDIEQGAIGVQLPQEAILERISVDDG